MRKRNLRTKDPVVDGYILDYESEESGRFIHDRVWAPRVTSWAIGHILACLYIRSAGGFGTHVSDLKTILKEFSAAFSVAVELDGNHIFEAANIIAVVTAASGFSREPYLNLHVWKELSAAEIPAVVGRYARQDGWASGSFATGR